MQFVQIAQQKNLQKKNYFISYIYSFNLFWKTVELYCDINFPNPPPKKIIICFDNRNYFRHSLRPVHYHLIPFLSIFEHFHTTKTLNLPLLEKSSHTELFLVRIFLYWDWIRSVHIQSFFWSVFSCIWTEYGPEKTPYLNTFHAMCILLRDEGKIIFLFLFVLHACFSFI